MAKLVPPSPWRHWSCYSTPYPVINMPFLRYVVWRDPLSTNSLGRVGPTSANHAESANGDHGVI
ncbi:MAG: hypothetical protein J4N94_06300, partial [Chloroflexi bacterium]|nr:hypothetical protein [Chloroflexota bacterium]